MNKIIKLIIEYKNTKDDYIFEDIVKIFNPLIISKCNEVIKDDKLHFFNIDNDELKQDLLIKLLNVIDHFKLKTYYDETNINKLKDNKQFINYIKRNSFKSIKECIKEFNLFCNENQFKKYLKKSIDNEILKKKKIMKHNLNIYSLNNDNLEGIEIINSIF